VVETVENRRPLYLVALLFVNDVCKAHQIWRAVQVPQLISEILLNVPLELLWFDPRKYLI
jgi:hypothetical protein